MSDYAPVEVEEERTVPDWISAEVTATWTAMQGVGQIEAYRIMYRMVRRLGYGDLRDPSLAPNEEFKLRSERSERR